MRGRCAFFPLNLIYAFTAMAEIPLLVAGLASFAVFVWTRETPGWWLGPLALALPILFRETGVALGLVMSAMLYFGVRDPSLRRTLAGGGLAFGVLVALVLSPAGAGRPSLWKANIIAQGRFAAIYSHAFALEPLPGSASAWTLALVHKFVSNLHSLVSLQGFAEGWLERTAMFFVLTGVPLGLWMWWRKRDGFALGVAAAAAVTLLLVADLCLYSVWLYRGIRSLLLMQPFVAVLWGIVIGRWTRNWGNGPRRLLVTVFSLLGVGAAIYVLQTEAPVDTRARQNSPFLESVVGDDQRMLVSPFRLSLDYVNQHYPQLWAFIPENCPTMQLLDARYGIDTLIMPAQPGMPQPKLCGTALEFAGQRVWEGTGYWLYRRQAAKPPSPPSN
jgi:hypothetical protein